MPDHPARVLLSEARAATERRLDTLATRLAAELGAPLGDAVAYALRTSGKRIRPALVIGAYRSAGGRSAGIEGIAAAAEVVHTYSLVHDDLPCMDDDAWRRGRPTTHVAFDVPTATSVGWLLVPAAVEQLGDGARELGLDDATLGRLAVTLVEAGGLNGMIGGQWRDLEAEGRQLDLEQLSLVHRGKTGALIAACCALGGLAAGAPPADQVALEQYGREVGLAFQIADDVLDATATTDQLGKTAGRDAVLGKATFVGLLGIEAARDAARRHADRAIAALEGSRLETGTLEALARYIITRSF